MLEQREMYITDSEDSEKISSSKTKAVLWRWQFMEVVEQGPLMFLAAVTLYV